MDSNRNFWLPWWQAGSAGSHLTDTEGDEEVLQSSFTTPHYSVPNYDWQNPGGESWQELEQLSWLSSDVEDQHKAEFGSQFWIELSENSRASSGSRKNVPAAGDGGDGGVVTAPENLGMCSRANKGPSPKSDPTTAVKTARNPVQKMIEEVKNSKTGRRHRGPNWSLQENQSFLQHMEEQRGKSPWKAVSDGLKAVGFVREAKACEDHWGVLLADLKKFGNHFRSDNILRDQHFWPRVGTMSREQRSQNGLPLMFQVEWFEAMARIVKDRSRKPRKTRSLGCSKDRIVHIAAGETPSCSCRQQPRVVRAASAAASSEIFDNPVRDGDGISELVRLLGSSDRNVTADQTIEVMRIGLEAQRMDLRRQEIEWEREQMHQSPGNGHIPEN